MILDPYNAMAEKAPVGGYGYGGGNGNKCRNYEIARDKTVEMVLCGMDVIIDFF